MMELVIGAVLVLCAIGAALTAIMYQVKVKLSDRINDIKNLSDEIGDIRELTEQVEDIRDKLEDTRDYILNGDLERTLHERPRREGSND